MFKRLLLVLISSILFSSNAFAGDSFKETVRFELLDSSGRGYRAQSFNFESPETTAYFEVVRHPGFMKPYFEVKYKGKNSTKYIRRFPSMKENVNIDKRGPQTTISIGGYFKEEDSRYVYKCFDLFNISGICVKRIQLHVSTSSYPTVTYNGKCIEGSCQPVVPVIVIEEKSLASLLYEARRPITSDYGRVRSLEDFVNFSRPQNVTYQDLTNFLDTFDSDYERDKALQILKNGSIYTVGATRYSIIESIYNTYDYNFESTRTKINNLLLTRRAIITPPPIVIRERRLQDFVSEANRAYADFRRDDILRDFLSNNRTSEVTANELTSFLRTYDFDRNRDSVLDQIYSNGIYVIGGNRRDIIDQIVTSYDLGFGRDTRRKIRSKILFYDSNSGHHNNGPVYNGSGPFTPTYPGSGRPVNNGTPTYNDYNRNRCVNSVGPGCRP
jgi:hypothetical protein